MKRHHAVAVLVLIFGGLLAYIQFDYENTSGAIQTGIICILLGVFAFFFEELRSWIRPVGITTPLIFLGLIAANVAFTGYTASAIFLCIGMIWMGFLRFLESKPALKEKIEPYIGIIILLIMTLFLLFRR